MPVTVPDRFHNVTLGGNTSGALAEILSGTLTIAGGNNITLSQVGNAVTISARNQLSAGMSAIGNTSGDTGIVDRRLVVAGGNNVTLSGSTAAGGSMTITISAANQTVQPEGTQTIGMSTLGNTSGDNAPVTGTGIQVVFAGGNNITLSQSTNGASATITISGAVAGGAQTGISGLANSETTYTSGSVTFSALGAITIRSTTGQHFQFSVNAQTVQPEGTQTIGMSNIGNTAGDTTPVTGTGIQVVLAGGNNITLSQSTNGSSATITISAFNQSVQPEGTQTIGMSNLGNTSGDTTPITGTGIRFVLAGGNNITLSQSTNGSSATVTISAFNQSQESNTIGMSNIGNTSGDTAIRSGPQLRIVLAGGNNITLSQSTNGSSATITISAFNQTSPVVGADIASVSSATNSGTATSQFAAEDHVHAGVGPFGVSNIGNTSGDTGVLYGRAVIVGGNNVTLSVSSSNNGAQTITISAAAGGAGEAFSGGISNLGNTSGDTGVVSKRLVLVGGDGIGLSGSTDAGSATVSILQVRTLKSWAIPHYAEAKSPGTVGNATFILQPWYCPGYLTAHSMLMLISGSGASGSTASITFPIGVYTQQTGASSSRLSLVASAQFTTSWTSGTNADNNWGGVFGMRRWAFPIDVSFTPGHYWIGVGHRSTNAGTFSFAGNASNQQMSGVFGATATSRQLLPFMGLFATTTLTAPDSILSNQVLGNPGNARVTPWVGFVNTNELNLGA